ncbi:MAG TPA: M3 family metallopeptidase, partial [Ramlibacter sp.]|nr:M3 family metallopeptidase [Ramlibacter sp.]
MQANPLLDFSDLPLFDQVQSIHVAPALAQLLAAADKALETVTQPDFPSQWTEIAKVLDTATEELGRTWGVVSHLNSVADTPELRAAYNEALPRITDFWTRLGSDERLYAKYKAIDPASLDPEQRQAHKNAVRNFVLGGAELQGAARERFAAIQERQAELSQKFSENSLDATDAYAYYASADELEGVPEDVIQSARAAAQADGKEGYKLTLKMPSYLPVMQFARSRALRERVYRAYVTRASDQGDPKFDNSALIAEILALRQEEARLLGYPNFGEVSLVPKMADSPAQVIAFLRDLAARARPYAERDVADMRAFAAERLAIADPQAWDWSYVGEKLKEERYAFSEQEVKQYFTAPKVLAGLFKIVETLFEVTIRRDVAPVWNPGVEFYRIERPHPERAGERERHDGEGTELVGQFYLDPAARTGKRGGAWMDDARARWLRPDDGRLQTPVAHLVCNFAEGVDGKPPLLTHDDVTTLFHEFGHGLQHMLTRVNERDVSGISGVEWDAV